MIQIGFKSDKGLKRHNNEDACFVMPREGVYMVADGVGGGNSGELASRTAVSYLAESIKAQTPIKEKTYERCKDIFEQYIKEANSILFSLAAEVEENNGMATTMVLAYLYENQVCIANVGDSRAYLLRDGTISQLTEDHTYVNTLLKTGVISEEEAKHHPKRNIITRALGGEETVTVDFFSEEIKKDDMILLCTDGLYGEVDEETIVEIMNSDKAISVICNDLVRKANQRGGNDNVTVVCIKV